MATPAEIAALNKALNSPSYNRYSGTQYPATPTQQPDPKTPSQTKSTPIPADNGLLRQPPKTSPQDLENAFNAPSASRGAAKYPNPAPKQSTPTPARYGEKIGNGINNLGKAAAIAQAAATIGGDLANFAKTKSPEAAAEAAVDALSLGLLAAPNPYAKAGGLFLSLLGKPLMGLFFGSKNNIASSSAAPFSGGQSAGVQYRVGFVVFYSDAPPRYHPPEGALGSETPPTEQQIREQGALVTGPIAGSVTLRGTGQILDLYIDGVRWTQIYNFGANPVAQIYRVFRNDGQPEGNPEYKPIVNNDGSAPNPSFDPNAIGDAIGRLEDLKNSVNGISQQNGDILDALKGLLNKNANPSLAPQPVAPNFTPQPAIAPPNTQIKSSPSPSSGSAPSPNFTPQTPKTGSPDDVVSKLKEQIKQAEQAAQDAAKVVEQTTKDRFKQTDCQFSCENLAKCFVDLTVDIFDGCNETNGTAKTKQITIQVLPKDKEKTKASFKELLEIRSRECSLNDKVLTVPEYWQVRVGQRPQAVVLYREFVNGKFTDTYYQHSIPHYNGAKGVKPNLSQFNKGEHSAIYVCKDNSKVQVYASTEAEAKRIVNEFEKLINPRLRGDIVHTGTRKGIKKTTIKPIRLDFFSTGQTKLSPDWSIAL
ncbi:hypothetical protein [Pseudanabaena yagii]|uniref:Uncharacterized protein n=1 Tax=Pseudanabaena yagii GIHE-NHR1 TaxID=2722753 RepID=A0ABX1LXT3_9CYAN|nr:hypothetical protein [Pseudanabaena yagii]NMF60166.1 hypothetical protein [Pseudanabaena yagii GIHE-NHR1]